MVCLSEIAFVQLGTRVQLHCFQKELNRGMVAAHVVKGGAEIIVLMSGGPESQRFIRDLDRSAEVPGAKVSRAQVGVTNVGVWAELNHLAEFDLGLLRVSQPHQRRAKALVISP